MPAANEREYFEGETQKLVSQEEKERELEAAVGQPGEQFRVGSAEEHMENPESKVQ